MKWIGHIPPVRAAALVLLAAVGTYANSLPNGFAFDDNTIIRGHPVVTEGRVADALRSSYWPEVAVGAGLYRPVRRHILPPRSPTSRISPVRRRSITRTPMSTATSSLPWAS